MDYISGSQPLVSPPPSYFSSCLPCIFWIWRNSFSFCACVCLKFAPPQHFLLSIWVTTHVSVLSCSSCSHCFGNTLISISRACFVIIPVCCQFSSEEQLKQVNFQLNVMWNSPVTESDLLSILLSFLCLVPKSYSK